MTDGMPNGDRAELRHPQHESDREKFDRIWREMDKLAEEIGKTWPKGLSAVDTVREQRR